MHEIHANPVKNSLTITLQGFMTGDEIAVAADEVIASARHLQAGFTVVTDISDFKPAKPEDAAHIARAQKELFELGAAKVIRVTGKSALGKLQLSRSQREAGVGYDVVEVATRAEADAFV